jgi:hypothetical protein
MSKPAKAKPDPKPITPHVRPAPIADPGKGMAKVAAKAARIKAWKPSKTKADRDTARKARCDAWP